MLTMTMKRWQMNLKFLGYYGGNIDGVAGALTREGTKRFQKNNGIVPTGIVNQNSIDKMREIICNRQNKCGAIEDGVAGEETIRKWNEYQINLEGTRKEKQYITEHFKRSEFACKDNCGKDDIQVELVFILEDIRKHFGNNAVIITSGCRCIKHNAKVGGVQGSRHILGKACDFYIKNVNMQDVLNYCKELVAQGKLRYCYTNNSNMKGVIHIDIW